MTYLMLHDIRDISFNFFPKRYQFPYFYSIKEFEELLIKFKPKSFNEKDRHKYIYTFDDGLIDHLYVAKLLFKNKIKAIFFIPSAPVFERKMIDSHKIQFILASNKEEIILSYLLRIIKNEFDIENDYLETFKKSKWQINIWSNEMIFITRILREFKSSIERKLLIDKLFCKFVTIDERDFSENFYLSFNQVDEISKMGHLIGGHGYKSLDLRYCNKSEIKNEILMSNKFISNFNCQEKLYAYANGGFNDYAIEILRNLNFKKAFTTNLEYKGSPNLKRYVYKRIDPSKCK